MYDMPVLNISFGSGWPLNLTEINKVLKGVKYSFSGTNPARLDNKNEMLNALL